MPHHDDAIIAEMGDRHLGKGRLRSPFSMREGPQLGSQGPCYFRPVGLR